MDKIPAPLWALALAPAGIVGGGRSPLLRPHSQCSSRETECPRKEQLRPITWAPAGGGVVPTFLWRINISQALTPSEPGLRSYPGIWAGSQSPPTGGPATDALPFLPGVRQASPEPRAGCLSLTPFPILLLSLLLGPYGPLCPPRCLACPLKQPLLSPQGLSGPPDAPCLLTSSSGLSSCSALSPHLEEHCQPWRSGP